METWKTLQELAEKYSGLVTRRLAVAGKTTNRAFTNVIDTKRLTQIDRGLFEVRAPKEGEPRDLHAAVLRAGEGAVATHRSALMLHGLWGYDGFPLEVTAPVRVVPFLPSINVIRGLVPPEHQTEVQGIPVTTVERTLFDVASTIDRVSLAAAIESTQKKYPWVLTEMLVRQRLGLARELERVFTLLLNDTLGRERPMDSVFEVRFWHRWPFTGLPMPTPQYPVKDGAFLMHLDFAWPEFKVAVETEGYETHGTKEAFHADARRKARLERLGWHVLEVTYKMFEDDFFGAVREMVERALKDRGYARGSNLSA